MQSPSSPPGYTNMQKGNQTQIFHQGAFTRFPDWVCVGGGGVYSV